MIDRTDVIRYGSEGKRACKYALIAMFCCVVLVVTDFAGAFCLWLSNGCRIREAMHINTWLVIIPPVLCLRTRWLNTSSWWRKRGDQMFCVWPNKFRTLEGSCVDSGGILIFLFSVITSYLVVNKSPNGRIFLFHDASRAAIDSGIILAPAKLCVKTGVSISRLSSRSVNLWRELDAKGDFCLEERGSLRSLPLYFSP